MKKDNQAIAITSIISAVVLVIALVSLFTGGASANNSVTVEGISTIDATPDLMTVYYNIETKGDTSAEAKNANEVIYNKLVVQLAIEGFVSSELKTQYYNIYPNYIWNENEGQTQDGYIASHSLKLELSSEEFDKISDIIDAGVNAGAGVSSINFELSQELQNQYKAEALELASQDAKVKAEAVASGFNKQVGRLISVQVSDFGYYPWNIYAAEDSSVAGSEGAKAATASITPGEQEITARVTATYKLR